MKIQGNEIKPGMIIEFKNDHWTVLKVQHVNQDRLLIVVCPINLFFIYNHL